MFESTLDTDCLQLRPVAPQDAKAILSYRSDAEANKYQSAILESLNDVYDFIDSCSSEFNEEDTWFQLVIIHTESEEIIGDVGIHFLDESQVEIGCTIAKHMQQKGYATETLITVIDFLFQQMKKHRIIASTDPRNTACIKLLERLSFRKEAHFIESYFHNDEWLDDVQYGIINKEWDQ